MEHFYIGTNSIRGSGGIYHMKLDSSDGSIYMLSSVQVYNSGQLYWAKKQETLYALSEGMTFMGQASGGILTLSTRADPPVIPHQAVSGGQRPCSIGFCPDGREFCVGHFFGGLISVWNPDDHLGFCQKTAIHTGGTNSPPASVHDVVYSSHGSHILALSAAEHAIHVYGRDNDFQRVYVESMKKGAFPRQMVFHGCGNFLYVVSQRTSEVFVYLWQPDKKQMLQLLQTVSTLPGDYAGINAPSAIRISPGGKLLAVANRIFNHISLYRIEATGHLGAAGYCPLRGTLPRDIDFSTDGSFLIAAETASDTVSCYRVDAAELTLKWMGSCPIPAPASIAIKRGGRR